MRNRSTFETKMQTKDPKTLVTYRITLDSFEGFLKDNNYTIAQETAEDINIILRADCIQFLAP